MASKLLEILRRETKVFSGRCFNKTSEVLSSSGAIDFREEIANFNLDFMKLLVRT